MSDYRGKNLKGMDEMQFGKILEKRKSFDHVNSIYDEVRRMLRTYGIIIVADSESIPQKIDVDCSEHDIKYKTEIRELQKCIAKQSELIRGYDEEILKLKAQCWELTQNEGFAYKRCNGNAKEIPEQPIKIADWLIDKYFGEELMTKDIAEMKKDSLRQIAEHLLVFCMGDFRLR